MIDAIYVTIFVAFTALALLATGEKELIDALAEALPAATMLVTADHGEAFGEHGFYGHMIGIHAEVLRVPLVRPVMPVIMRIPPKSCGWCWQT